MRIERPSLVLLGALVFLFLVLPLLGPERRVGSVLAEILYAVTLVAGLYSLTGKRQTVVLAVALVGPALVLAWAGTLSESRALVAAGRGFAVVALLEFLRRLVRRLVAARTAGPETISVAICGYLTIGVAWSLGYSILWLTGTGEFGGLTDGNVGKDLFYFSFVTLTTLGYGDIAALSPFARSLSVLEAVVGQLYLAVVVARLVGLMMMPARPT